MTALDWTPPVGMTQTVTRAWRNFYSDMLRDHEITPQDYRALYLAQQGRCYVCRTATGKHPDDPKGRGGRRLGVDHHHALTGRAAVRGLLCTGSTDPKTCNRLIAFYNADQLYRASDYLRFPPAPAVLEMVRNGATDQDLIGVALR